MSNDLVLCECSKCKKNGIGKYVHRTTKWRHSNKKRKHNIELIENDIDDHHNEKYSGCDYNDDGDDKNKDYEVYSRLYSEVYYFKK
jgi:hypothetical protein